MPTYLGFLRAVNVGNRQVQMATLRTHLEAAGFTDVETFIASGNVKVTTPVRNADTVERSLERELQACCGFEVPTVVRTPAQMRAAYDAAETLAAPLGDDARHYVALLKRQPTDAAARRLDQWDRPGERALVSGREVHLWLSSPRPSLTNARVEKLLATTSTQRDWKTIARIVSRWT